MSKKRRGRSRAARRRQKASESSMQTLPCLYQKKGQETASGAVTDGADEPSKEVADVMNYYKAKKPYTGEVRRGDIFFFDKNVLDVGVEQYGGRPGIIVSNDTSNKHSEFVEVVYTTTQQKPPIPTHVDITSLKKPCTALCEQVHTLSKKKIVNRSGRCSDSEMAEIDRALKINFGLAELTVCESISMCDYKELYDDILDRVFGLIEKGNDNEKR